MDDKRNSLVWMIDDEFESDEIEEEMLRKSGCSLAGTRLALTGRITGDSLVLRKVSYCRWVSGSHRKVSGD